MEQRRVIILFVVLCVIFSSLLVMDVKAEESTANEDLFEMSIEELMDVEITYGASLTSAPRNMQPSAITTITEEQIRASGARSLMELLDIYVPNFQWIHNDWEPDNLGLRGIISDRDDKYLLLVNGRIMNERTHYGVWTEKDLVFFGDIYYVEVIRGPGSALYGPGAVSMVINIVTHSSKTFEGSEVITRAGAGEEFYSVEYKYGKPFENDNGGWFLYGGVSSYPGASDSVAPMFGAAEWNTIAGNVPAGNKVKGIGIPNDGEAYNNGISTKFHAQLELDNLTLWARHTRGGKQFPWDYRLMTGSPIGWSGTPVERSVNSYNYDQLTFFIGYKEELDAKTTIDYSISYDKTATQRLLEDTLSHDNVEEKYMGKVLLRHDINDNHKIAAGYEAYFNRFEKQGGDQWFTHMHSFLGEYQWILNDDWVTFIGGRFDDHKYSEPMISPRVSVAYTPNEQDSYKFIWSRSVRANFEEDMHNSALAGSPDGVPEELESVELRYERNWSKHFDTAVSWYTHYNLELISWDNNVSAPVPIGTQRDWGLEVEANYHTEKARVGISHAFAKLYDFDFIPGQSYTLVTSDPYGYGDDFARWSNHITKVNGSYKIDDKLTLDGSFRVYWGFQGMEDWDNYRRDVQGEVSVDENWEKSYRPNCYLNLGLQYNPSENLTYRIDGMNLLGIFNPDFNKRNYTGGARYRSHAASVVFSMRYTF